MKLNNEESSVVSDNSNRERDEDELDNKIDYKVFLMKNTYDDWKVFELIHVFNVFNFINICS